MVAFTNLGVSTEVTTANPDIRDIGDAASYANTAWTPPTSGILIADVLSAKAAAETLPDSVTGNGITWVELATIVFSGVTRRITRYGAFAAGSSNGATTISFGADTQLGCYVSFYQITGADESGTIANAFAQHVSNTGTGTLGSVTLAAAGDSGNRAFAYFAHLTNELVSKDSDANWTKLDDFRGAGPALGSISEYRGDAFDTVAEASWTTSSAWAGLASEVKVAAAGGATEDPFPYVAGGYYPT